MLALCILLVINQLFFRINHSNNAIVKPPELTPQAAAKELEDVMKKVREAQSTIAAVIEPGMSSLAWTRTNRVRLSLNIYIYF